MPASADSARRGRLLILAAAVLWSLSGFFTRVIQDTSSADPAPQLTAGQLAFYRVLFAGLFFLPLMRPRRVTFHVAMPIMVVVFTVMNWLFISAMADGTAANAIWLQYTAPIWMVFLALLVLGERVKRQDLWGIALGMLGVGVIVSGGWRAGEGGQRPVILMALGSGVTYAGVLVCLRLLRGSQGAFLTGMNHLGAAVCFLPLVWGLPLPSWEQLLLLALFGVIQMGVPYWMMSRGLNSVSPQEAGMIALLEPILNPLWAYLVAPERETFRPETWLGAGLILTALVWRYAPGLLRTARVARHP